MHALRAFETAARRIVKFHCGGHAADAAEAAGDQYASIVEQRRGTAIVGIQHLARRAEGPIARIVEFRRVERVAVVVLAARDQNSAIPQQRCAMMLARHTHAAGGMEPASRRVVDFRAVEHDVEAVLVDAFAARYQYVAVCERGRGVTIPPDAQTASRSKRA